MAEKRQTCDRNINNFDIHFFWLVERTESHFFRRKAAFFSKYAKESRKIIQIWHLLAFEDAPPCYIMFATSCRRVTARKNIRTRKLVYNKVNQ